MRGFSPAENAANSLSTLTVAAPSATSTATPFSKPRKTIKGAVEILPTQRIVAVDVALGAATVKVESEFAAFSAGEKPRKHFQYLSLLKVAGEWKIVSVLMPTEFEESASK